MAAEAWRLVNEQSWIVFVVMTLALLGLTLTYAWALLYERRRGRYGWLAVAAGLALVTGALLAGMQAGERPLLPREMMLPWVRGMWLVGSVLLLVFLAIYWVGRIEIRR